MGLGAALLELGEVETAQAALNQLLTNPPTDAESIGEARRLLGEALLAQDKFTGAAEQFHLAAGVPNYTGAANAVERQAFSLYTGGRHADAATAYQKLAKEFPASPLAKSANLSAGKCLVLAGQADQAAKILGKQWHNSPTVENAEAAHWLSHSLLEARNATNKRPGWQSRRSPRIPPTLGPRRC